MAEESEKRFEAVMKKLFHAPTKSRQESNNAAGQGSQKLGSRKRLHPSSAGTKSAKNAFDDSPDFLLNSTVSVTAPQCRPWDRNDLFRRLATFKSMTWFAKPQVVSPLECARRGWVNIDADTISCTSCDARLLFSTPFAWTHQQVGKAAMVFSLKLESGHKLLCPWINNICTEELARFPILSSDSLIEDYKKRFLSLSHLLALPVILPAAIACLRSSQLEHFLRECPTSGVNTPHEQSMAELAEDVPKSTSSISYYQAQKMISLFGWEPHVLPYRVDFKDGKNQSLKDGNVTVTEGEKKKVSIYSLCTSESTKTSSEMQFDPGCVVLDCKLCGASVGLWAFSTIPRPLEYLRFVGPTVVKGKSTSIPLNAEEGSSSNHMHIGNNEGIANAVTTDSASLGFSIAGGLPPALLNYDATISLPVVGENLRARFPLEIENEDHLAIHKSSEMLDQQTSIESANVSGEGTPILATDLIPKILLDTPQTGGDSSVVNVNLTETATTVNTTATDDILVAQGGDTEPNRQELNEAQSEQGRNIGGEDKILPSYPNLKEFDPIKQHRHFCPWIFLAGKYSPGWQQTLTALGKENEPKDVSSSSLIEVDDPVASVEKLFTPSSKKRAKISGGS
ncbi:uncharacterized protein LOC127262976 [Andrographis paniculata]|uniref:uncharacterized protein LOC127262976 n=1 Tax=Andrographis paniculata TaxID=175694 RepID=UPI0021E835E9|nr:uncharacterized protein LOC127262976 [Andrographis paniculata]